MENLYKLNEFTGKLPNPKSFPMGGVTIIAVKDKPYIFADGFIVDLSVREKDKEKLGQKVVRAIDISSLNGYMRDAKGSELLLSEPEFIYNTVYPAYVVFTPNGNPIVVLVKYYKYFRNKYPECNLYIKDKDSKLIGIKVNEEVVGLCMAMFFSNEILGKIKEERK